MKSQKNDNWHLVKLSIRAHICSKCLQREPVWIYQDRTSKSVSLWVYTLVSGVHTATNTFSKREETTEISVKIVTLHGDSLIRRGGPVLRGLTTCFVSPAEPGWIMNWHFRSFWSRATSEGKMWLFLSAPLCSLTVLGFSLAVSCSCLKILSCHILHSTSCLCVFSTCFLCLIS